MTKWHDKRFCVYIAEIKNNIYTQKELNDIFKDLLNMFLIDHKTAKEAHI